MGRCRAAAGCTSISVKSTAVRGSNGARPADPRGPRATARPAAPTTDMDQARADLDAKGYCVIPGVLDKAEIAVLKARLVAQAEGEDARGVGFHDGGPARTNQRVWMLLNKGRVFRDLM